MDRVWFVFAAQIDQQDLAAGHTSISVAYRCAFGVDGLLVAIVVFFFAKQGDVAVISAGYAPLSAVSPVC